MYSDWAGNFNTTLILQNAINEPHPRLWSAMSVQYEQQKGVAAP